MRPVRRSPRLRPIAAGVCCLGVSLALLGGWSTPVRAEDDDPNAPALQAILKNTEEGAVFSVEGRTLPLPDGARLVVNLVAKGKAKDVTCSLFRVPVSGSAYRGGDQWKQRTLAPLNYEARVELVVAKQAPAVKDWIMKEYGYTAEHREILDTRELPVGTPQEQAEFSRKNLRKIRGLAVALGEIRDDAEALLATAAAEQPEWDASKRAMDDRIVAYRRELDDYRLSYVALLETGYFNRLLKTLKDVARFVRDHGKGKKKNLHARTVKLRGHVLSIIESIDARLPVQGEAVLGGGE